jgi:hypothetical protein
VRDSAISGRAGAHLEAPGSPTVARIPGSVVQRDAEAALLEHAPQHHWLRYDRLDTQGRMSLRRAT